MRARTRPAPASASRPPSASAPRSTPARKIPPARSNACTARSRPARGGCRRNPSTTWRRSTASSRARGACPCPCWWASCRCTASATPSSCTTRCPACRSPTTCARGFARPATARSAPGSSWRRRSSARFAAAGRASTSCRRSAASRSSPRCSMSSADGLVRLGAREAARRIREGGLSPVALVDACLERISALDGDLSAWAHVDAAGARVTAREREAQARAGGALGPLHGVPVGIKDIFDVAGMPTTGGARSWAHTRPGKDATAVARVRAAGAVLLGKTYTTEFAYRDPAPTRNPWNHEHTPGGSSAGSGAAVGARMVPLALGSQTVGSVLRPAAYCGVVGVKPTHGAIPVDGVIPLAWSLDHVGVLARSVTDAGLALGVLMGRVFDPVAARAPRLAVAGELIARCEPATAAQIQVVIDRLARAGASIVEAKLPASFADLAAAGLVVLEAEAAAFHEESWRAHEAEYGREMSAMVRAGLGGPAGAYVGAARARLRFREEVLPLLAGCHALLAPTAPAPAPAGLGWTGDASLCAPWTWAGVPAITLPSGLAANGLPHAVQLVTAAGEEQRLLDAAQFCEDTIAFTAAPRL